MDRTVPSGAALLLDFIGEIEAPKGYDTIYGNNQGKLSKPVTSMTVDEILLAQPEWSRRFGSSATGRYQFMYATLGDLKQELGLRGTQVFDPDLQDRLAYHLLKRRGYDDFVAGKIDAVTFGKRLAQEWASLPVLRDTQGAHQPISRGQSYYAGDKLNKSLIPPGNVEAVLERVKAANVAPIPVEKPLKPLGPKVEKPTQSPKPASPGRVPDPGGNLRFILIGAVGLIILALIAFIVFN